jgi:sugar/nucleoside kinase (ribokinase family)
MTDTVWSLGSILVDVTVEVPVLPERGGDMLATGSRTVAGGGFNLAAAVARQGVRCVYAAPHGTGAYGDLIRSSLAAEGIAVAGTARTDGDSGFCVVLVEPDGERTFVTAAGVEAALTPADLAALPLGDGDLLSVSGYDLVYPVSGPVLAAWLPSVPAGVRVVLDPGPLVADIPRLPDVDVLTLNQREARLLAKLPDAVGTTLLEAVHDGDRLTVLREGAAGCRATGGPLGTTVVAVPAPPVRAVDTTGAGDAHTGVLLAALARGLDVEAALIKATEAAAVAVTRRGPAEAPRLAWT